MITELKLTVVDGEIKECFQEVPETVEVNFIDADGVRRNYELPKSKVVPIIDLNRYKGERYND